MRIVIVLSLLLAGCVTTDHKEYGNKLFLGKSEYSESTKASEIDNLGIVLIRVEFDENKGKPNDKLLSLLFTTQPDLNASRHMILGSDEFHNSSKFIYQSVSNKFLALLVPSGTYRYISSWREWGLTSRLTPTKEVAFQVEAGKAKYVGDLKLYFTEDDYIDAKTLFGRPYKKFKPEVIDYRFRVESDFSAAKQFYDSIPKKPKWPLMEEMMTIQPLHNVKYYANPKCNGFWHSYSEGRGACY